jgi:hydrogenase maturation protein HypF
MIAVAPLPTTEKSAMIRRRWRVCGIVQGVGFRPWVCLAATRLKLTGEVGNDASGVWIEAEGKPGDLLALVEELRHAPEPVRVESVLEETLGSQRPRLSDFRIVPSCLEGDGGAALAPDLAPCADCRQELLDPLDRRYGYPFLACARCGPRYTVTRSLPYDRARTSLVEFPLCPDCAAEYADPGDRRFHAESIACPRCGPRLRALASDGQCLAEENAAIDAACAILEAGQILAVQAVGGFQLWTDATRSSSVARLRECKHRDAKPFAVMVRDIAEAKDVANLTPHEALLLTSPEAPIVLVKSRPGSFLAPEIAPGCTTVGLCLPASPLQWLLCEKFSRPVVATSGNLSDEPLCHDPSEAVIRLGKVADLLLLHDREILQPADDSVVRVMAGRVRMIRRARGYAPAPIRMPLEVDRPGLAVGGQVKGALALVRGRDLVLSPHLGDQDTVLARERHADTAVDLQRLLRLKPSWVACDSHPDYTASVSARCMALPRLEVQHHHAHLLAVLAEQTIMPAGPVLGVIWDGSGYGPDGTVWGGEFLLACGASCRRVGYLRRFTLPGGERAVREPRRSAFAWLWETLGPQVAHEAARRFDLDAHLMGKLCEGAAGTLQTSSAGRLFDAVAALAGLCPVARYEGEAAMLLESAAIHYPKRAEPYPFSIRPDAEVVSANVRLAGDCEGWALDLPELPEMPAWEVNTAPLAEAVWQAVCAGVGAPEIAARFHQTLVAITAEMARRVALSTVVPGGGCFQNALLLESVESALSAAGHEVLMPERFPANDGGLAAGQAFAGAWLHPPIQNKRSCV